MSQKIRQDISIGKNIRSLRRQAHLTQEQVVAHLQLKGLEMSRSSYSQIECGTHNIRVSELVALAELFQVDFNAFFQDICVKSGRPASSVLLLPYDISFYFLFNWMNRITPNRKDITPATIPKRNQIIKVKINIPISLSKKDIKPATFVIVALIGPHPHIRRITINTFLADSGPSMSRISARITRGAVIMNNFFSFFSWAHLLSPNNQAHVFSIFRSLSAAFGGSNHTNPSIPRPARYRDEKSRMRSFIYDFPLSYPAKYISSVTSYLPSSTVTIPICISSERALSISFLLSSQ